MKSVVFDKAVAPDVQAAASIFMLVRLNASCALRVHSILISN